MSVDLIALLVSIFLGFVAGALLGVAGRQGLWRLYIRHALDLLALQEEYFGAMLYSEEPKYREAMKEHMADLLSKMRIKQNKMKAIWNVRENGKNQGNPKKIR